jgi:DNA-binding MarR family transcriptional regulator
MDRSPEHLEVLADIFSALSNRSRLAVLYGLYEGSSMPEVAEFLDVQRGALQRPIEGLIERGLVYRPSDDRSYALTPLGVFLVERVREYEDALDTVVELLDEAEAAAREDMEAARSGMSERDFEKAVRTAAWERVMEDIEDELDVEEE